MAVLAGDLESGQDSVILRVQNFARNWPACTELSSVDQMAQKLKNFADFLTILLPSSALITSAALAKQFGVKLIKYFAEICE